MSLLTILLQAAGGSQQWSGILMMVVIVAIFYFFMIRPQQKKQKEIYEQFKYLDYARIVFTSAKTGQRVDQIFPLIQESYENSRITSLFSIDVKALKIEYFSIFS